MSNSAKKYKRMAVAALAAALIFLVVAFLQIPFPIGQGGYINIGDAFIFLFATLLPLPYAVAAAAVGAALADVASGYAVYAPFTLLIKAAMAFCFDSRRKGFGARNLLASGAAVAILVVGYYLADAVLARSFIVPLAPAPFNLIQGAVSAALFAGLSYMLEKSAFYNELKEDLRWLFQGRAAPWPRTVRKGIIEDESNSIATNDPWRRLRCRIRRTLRQRPCRDAACALREAARRLPRGLRRPRGGAVLGAGTDGGIRQPYRPPARPRARGGGGYRYHRRSISDRWGCRTPKSEGYPEDVTDIRRPDAKACRRGARPRRSSRVSAPRSRLRGAKQAAFAPIRCPMCSPARDCRPRPRSRWCSATSSAISITKAVCRRSSWPKAASTLKTSFSASPVGWWIRLPAPSAALRIWILHPPPSRRSKSCRSNWAAVCSALSTPAATTPTSQTIMRPSPLKWKRLPPYSEKTACVRWTRRRSMRRCPRCAKPAETVPCCAQFTFLRKTSGYMRSAPAFGRAIRRAFSRSCGNRATRRSSTYRISIRLKMSASRAWAWRWRSAAGSARSAASMAADSPVRCRRMWKRVGRRCSAIRSRPCSAKAPACSFPSALTVRFGWSRREFWKEKRRSMSERLEAFTLFSSSKGNSALFRYQNECILIDAGVSARALDASLHMLGASLREVKAVFVTHEHSDHIKGLEMIARHFRIPIYAPYLCCRFIRAKYPSTAGLLRVLDGPVEAGPVSSPFLSDAARRGGFGLLPRGSRKCRSWLCDRHRPPHGRHRALRSRLWRRRAREQPWHRYAEKRRLSSAAQKAHSRWIRASFQPYLRDGPAAAGRKRRPPRGAGSSFPGEQPPGACIQREPRRAGGQIDFRCRRIGFFRRFARRCLALLASRCASYEAVYGPACPAPFRGIWSGCFFWVGAWSGDEPLFTLFSAGNRSCRGRAAAWALFDGNGCAGRLLLCRLPAGGWTSDRVRNAYGRRAWPWLCTAQRLLGQGHCGGGRRGGSARSGGGRSPFCHRYARCWKPAQRRCDAKAGNGISVFLYRALDAEGCRRRIPSVSEKL